MAPMTKPPLEPLHRWIIGLWLLGLVATVLNFLSVNQGGGWLEELVAPLVIAFFVAGLLVTGLAAGLARFVASGRYVRLGILVGIPGLVAVWLAGWGEVAGVRSTRPVGRG